MMKPMSWNNLLSRPTKLYALLCGLMAAAVYLMTMAGDAVIGESARLISAHSGLDPLAPLSYYLWGLAGRIFQIFPVGSLSFRWNLLSVVSGAASVGMICLLTTRFIGNRNDRNITEANLLPLKNLGGISAALLLAFCTPFHLVSTMAHPATFNLAILLFALWLMFQFIETGRFSFALGSSIVMGITTTQYATTLMMAPAYILVIFYWLWRRNNLSASRVAKLLMAFAAGISPYFIYAGIFRLTPSFQWAEMGSYVGVLWNIWREQYLLIRYGLPGVGWTIVLLFSLVPALMVILFNKDMKPGTLIMLIVAAAVGFLLFFNVRFAPWPLLGFQPLLIMPYVIGAAWCGCLVSYGMGYLLSSWFIRSRRNRRSWLVPVVSGIYLLTVTGIIGLMFVLNLKERQIKPSVVFTRFAEQIVNQLSDGEWVVVDDNLEHLIRIKLHESGKSALLLAESRFANKPYQRYLHDVLQDEPLGNMAEVGVIPLLRERMQSDREPYPAISSLLAPQILGLAGLEALPDRTLYRVPIGHESPPEEYMQRHRDTWSGTGSDLLAGSDNKDAHGELKNRLLLNLSRIANDAGLHLEDQGRPDLAKEAYREAARLFRYNLSARLNLLRLIDETDDEFTPLVLAIEEISANLRGKANLNQIMDSHGFIRHPASAISDAARWNRAGSTELGMQALEKNTKIKVIEDALAIREDNEAFQALMDVISPLSNAGESTNAAPALISIVRLSVMKDRYELARRFIVHLEGLGLPAEIIMAESANVDLAEDKPLAAYRKLSSLNEHEIQDPRTWLLLVIASTEANPQETPRYLEKLEANPDLAAPHLLTLAQVYMSRGSLDDAARHLDRLLRTRPLDQNALELLLRIRLDQKQLDHAVVLIKPLLQLDTRHALANYALGAIYYRDGQYQKARAAWEISLKRQPFPETQNNLAFLLHELGENEDALKLADQSLQSKPTGSAWHTKAVILKALGQREKAIEAIEKGLSLQPDSIDLLELRDTLKAN